MGAGEDLAFIGGRVAHHISIAVDNVVSRRAWRRPDGPRRREHPAEPRRESQGGAEEARLGVGAEGIQNARRGDKGHDLLETYFM